MRPNIVYVPINWSLRFYILQYVKSHAILTHIAYDFEYIGTLPLSHMLLTLLRLTTKKNYKSDPLVMKPVGPYRNRKNDLILIMTPEKQDKTLELSKH